MPRLLLMRHAKSDWHSGAASDFDRPLNARGRAAAAAMAAFVARISLVPARVYCSPARRTRETLAAFTAVLPDMPHAIYRRALYDNGLAAYLAALATDMNLSPLLIVGHNPAIHDTALFLTGTGDRATYAALAEKMPTGALTVIDFPGVAFPNPAAGRGSLTAFVRPRSLEVDGRALLRIDRPPSNVSKRMPGACTNDT